MNPVHKHSIEHLHHFQCGYCNGWWSIGDWKEIDAISCPHCGKSARLDEPDEVTKNEQDIARIAFEGWVSSPPYEREIARFDWHSEWPGQYKDIAVELAWCAVLEQLTPTKPTGEPK
jgi:hypothetical protein